MAKKSKYKIGEACRELDIQPYVLRYWETEFSQLSGGATTSGQRTYSTAEIGIIRRIKELLYEEGYTIAGAKKKLETELIPPEDGEAEQAALDDATDEERAEEKTPERKSTAKASKKRAKKAAAKKASASSSKSDGQPPADTQIARKLEQLRSDLEVLRDEARSLESDLRQSADS